MVLVKHNASKPDGLRSPIISHRHVSSNIDDLKYGAAASLQLPSLHIQPPLCHEYAGKDSLLVVSPYLSRSHLLDLSRVSQPNQILAKALTLMKPVREDYATAPYGKSFNWDEVVDMVKQLSVDEGFDYKQEEESFYIVVFRSRVPPTTDRSHLAELDEKAHEEAMETGGLLKYWFGTPDTEGNNLATCVWRYRDDAINGSRGEGHRRAMLATKGLYTSWKVDRLKLVVKDGAMGWEIIEWPH